MWFAIFSLSTGQLFSLGTVVATDEELAAAGLGKTELGESIPDGEWDPVSHTFVPYQGLGNNG